MSLVSDIQQAVDETSGAVFWSTDQIYDAANAAILDAFTITRHEFVLATMTVTAEADLVDIPATIMIPQYILGTDGKYFPTTQAKLEQENRAWRGTALGQTKFFVLWDIEHFRCYPRMNVDYAFDVGGVPWPTVGEVMATNTDISVPGLLKQAITHKAIATLLDATQPMLADVHTSEADQLLYKFKRQYRNRSGHNIRRIRPGTLFTKAQSGVIRIGDRFY